MKPIRKEYNNLIYNDDFTCCLGMARETDKIILHENTKEIFGQEGNHFHKYVTEIIVNDKLERINPGALDRCNIKKIDLSHTKVRVISGHAFECCKSLKEVILPETLTYLGKYCFLYCKELEKINLEDTGLVQIDDNCFEDCLKLKNVKLPPTLSRIEKASFIKCDIETLDLSNTKVTRLNPDTFTKCTALKEIILPKNLETICSYAFADCIMLSSPVLPNSLIKINSDAFRNTRFNTLTLPRNLEYVGPIIESSNINKIYYSKLEKSVYQSILKEINESKNCQLIGQSLESLINDGKSFKEINKIIKDNQPTI